MAKLSKKKSQNEPISVSEIYETIQARDFLRELWWDLISDIQEKPTYKRIKAMVTDVINNTTKTFTSKSVGGNEELKWRTALTEISIMTYTLDTVISEVLYRRYQNEFEDIVKNLIKDLLAKEAPNPSEDDSVFENIESIFDIENPKLIGKKGNDHTIMDAKKSAKDVGEVSDAPVRKRGRPKKVNVDSKKAKNMNTVPIKKRCGRPPATTEKSMSESFKNEVKKENDVQESEAESDISIGNLSIDSVSSVHTSELSSFEDTVSICSGDEKEKKRVPLKVANEMYVQGKLSQIYYFGKRSERFKLMQNACASNSKDSVKTNISSSANVDTLSRKVLPQRIRKPNSKYTSETMYCDVKDYSSPPADTGSSSSQEEMDNKSSKSPKIRRKRKKSSLDKETASKSSAVHNVSSARNNSPSKRTKISTSPLLKASTKRYNTSDLYKPRPVAGSTIGSRSTAVTLFSS